MGRLARTLQDMPTGALATDPAWRSAGALRRAAVGWLELLVANEDHVRERRDSIRASMERVCRSSWSARPTHGDFVPANVLMHEGGVEVLLDVTGLALRHPEVDVAWWELVVGFHHPADATRLARSLRRGYGARDVGMNERLRDVGTVRALQLAAAAPSAARGHAVALLSAAMG
jgi:Ser/Thr protein kinase RdoA (MazF antagonist)